MVYRLKYFILILVIIISGCKSLSYIELEIESDSLWNIAVTEYSNNKGYLQSDNIYSGYGNSKILFYENIPQYVYAWNFTKDANVSVYKVYKDGTREDVSERMSSGAVEWWRVLKEVSIEDF